MKCLFVRCLRTELVPEELGRNIASLKQEAEVSEVIYSPTYFVYHMVIPSEFEDEPKIVTNRTIICSHRRIGVRSNAKLTSRKIQSGSESGATTAKEIPERRDKRE